MPRISGIHHVAVTVTDLDRSVDWYREVLELVKLMEEVHPDGIGHAVVLGNPDWSMCVGLHSHPDASGDLFSEKRTGLDHASFLVESRAELEAWESRFSELGVQHSPLNDCGSYAVVVFRDPDNIQLELIAMGG